MAAKIAALLALCALVPQDIPWKAKWSEALKEAKASKKLAILVFFNKGVKDCKTFESDALANSDVVSSLKQHVCAKIDPEGPDEDNKLWQEHGAPRLPMTFVYDPEGKRLTEIGTINAKYYASQLDAAGSAYFNKIVPARESLAKDPNQPEKLAMLGEAYAQLNVGSESAGYYTKAVDLLEKKGDKEGALKILESQLATYHGKKPRWNKESRAACKKIAEIDPSNQSKLRPFAAWVTAMADCEERKWNDAISSLGPAVNQYKESPLIDKMKFTLASAYMYSNDKAGAIRIFEDIVLTGKDEETVNVARTQVEKLKK